MTSGTLLLRQAHPNFMDGASPTSQIFIPFPRDDYKLSAYDGDMVSPQDSYAHYTQALQNRSDGVWAVTKSEADLEGVTAGPDPLPNFPEHAKIDFSTKPSKTEQRRIAKLLLAHALTRGCQYRP